RPHASATASARSPDAPRLRLMTMRAWSPSRSGGAPWARSHTTRAGGSSRRTAADVPAPASSPRTRTTSALRARAANPGGGARARSARPAIDEARRAPCGDRLVEPLDADALGRGAVRESRIEHDERKAAEGEDLLAGGEGGEEIGRADPEQPIERDAGCGGALGIERVGRVDPGDEVAARRRPPSRALRDARETRRAAAPELAQPAARKAAAESF